MSEPQNDSESSSKINTMEKIANIAAGFTAVITLMLAIYTTFFLQAKPNTDLEPAPEPSPTAAVAEPADDSIYGVDDFADDDARLAYSADLIGDGKYRDAVNFLKSFLEAVEPDSETALAIHFNLGLAYLYREKWNEAVNNLLIVTRRADYADAYYNLGRAYMGLNQPEPALSAFEKALGLEQKPEYEMARDAAQSILEENPTGSMDE